MKSYVLIPFFFLILGCGARERGESLSFILQKEPLFVNECLRYRDGGSVEMDISYAGGESVYIWLNKYFPDPDLHGVYISVGRQDYKRGLKLVEGSSLSGKILKDLVCLYDSMVVGTKEAICVRCVIYELKPK